MNLWLSLLALAVLQGVAEFLPISSSGHLVAAQRFLGFSAPGIHLELALHLGTLVAVCVFYAASLRSLVAGLVRRDRTSWLVAGALALSMIPCGIVYAVAGDWLEDHFENVSFVGPALVATGLLLLTTRRGMSSANPRPVSPAQGFLMGIGQAVAMLPGVSRSGSTIWVARLCRVDPDEAARFSFLMSVPVIGGASLVKLLPLVCGTPEVESAPEVAGAGLSAWQLLVGGAVAAVVGYISLSVLVRVLRGGRFWMFGLYCLLAGLALILLG